MLDPARWLRYALLTMVVVLAYALILGKGGWLRIRALDQQIAAQKATNLDMQKRNEALSAEVQDLRKGSDALEERARVELGMVRQGEAYYRYVQSPPPTPPATKP
ncbi:MAG: cell division protein FtsB [Betaproteobacteria bacterium]|nr:cell division protein FtsB [Betaproteobacteria bacterium]MDE2131494.1 cell division protein FtsB [Betaproteobacteria bacterium]MDE2211909.1 cell division protein FtsB [Betaproteobacteria bacterium]MDE2624152.1 cell division protein FtsB [Betaproteobacteria bacterium]